MFSIRVKYDQYKSQETIVNTDQGSQVQDWQVEGNMDGVIRIGRDFTGSVAVGENGTRLSGNLTSLGVKIDGGPRQTLTCHHRLSEKVRPLTVQLHTRELQLVTQRQGPHVFNQFEVRPLTLGQEADVDLGVQSGTFSIINLNLSI